MGVYSGWLSHPANAHTTVATLLFILMLHLSLQMCLRKLGITSLGRVDSLSPGVNRYNLG